MHHRHWVQRGDNELEVEAECVLSDDECTFGLATPRELGEWVNYGQNYAVLVLRKPPVPFATWLRGYQESKGRIVEDKGFYRPMGAIRGPKPLQIAGQVGHPMPTEILSKDGKTDVLSKAIQYEQEVLAGDHRADYQATAKKLVRRVVNEMHDMGPLPEYELYVVWFCKTLQNWKALLTTTMADGMYFEVTFNGDKNETYVDAYKKQENIVFYNKVDDPEDEG